jgi:DNA-binding MarR family transcriptional regulator
MSRDSAGLLVPEIDAFIHEPARLRLLTFLSVLDGADFSYLLANSGLSPGNLSAQMNKLAAAGYLEIEKGFVSNRPRTVYRLTDVGREALRGYKRTMGLILSALPD